MKIIITGGVGFIGTNCACYFAKNKNNQLVLIDNFSRPKVEKNALSVKKNFPNIKIIKDDVANIKKYSRIVAQSDLIIHLAGQTAVTTSIKNPKKDFQDNLFASFNLLETARQYSPWVILIYSSTNKVYGDLRHYNLKKNHQQKKYFDVDHPAGIDENEIIDFISPYGCSKGATDFYFQDYSRIYGLKTVVFRQSCIYGPHQIGVEDQGWVAHFTKQFILKKPINIFGDGFQVRDLLYVDDLIAAYQLAIKKINLTKGQVFNIGGGINNAYSLLQIIDKIKKIFGYSVPIKFARSRLGDQKYFVSSNKKISITLGWQPKTSLNEGLKKLINWQLINLKKFGIK